MTRLEEIEARLAKATPGPWQSIRVLSPDGTLLEGIEVWRRHDELICTINNALPIEAQETLADQISFAPEDLAWLISEVKRYKNKFEVWGRKRDELDSNWQVWESKSADEYLQRRANKFRGRGFENIAKVIEKWVKEVVSCRDELTHLRAIAEAARALVEKYDMGFWSSLSVGGRASTEQVVSFTDPIKEALAAYDAWKERK